jgi:hypothetical protein
LESVKNVMADVRPSVGLPTQEAFRNDMGSPIVVNSVTGESYTLIGSTVTPIPSRINIDQAVPTPIDLISGTVTYNQLKVTETDVNVGANILNVFKINHIIGGTGATTGGRHSFEVSTGLTHATNASNTLRYYAAAVFTGYSDVNDTGTGGSPKGAVYGINAVGRLNNAAATNFVNVSAIEANIGCVTGSSVFYKSGIQICGHPDDAVQGSSYDGMLSLSGGGGVGWVNGVLFSAANGGDPVSTTGSLIKTQGAATVGYGVDISSYTITNDAFKSTGISIAGSGRVNTTASSTTRAYLNLPHGAAPSSPVDGDVWTTTAGLFVRINGATIGPLS